MTMTFKTKLHYFLITICAVASLTALQVDGQTKKKKITYYPLDAGTVLRVRLHHELSSKTAAIGRSGGSSMADARTTLSSI